MVLLFESSRENDGSNSGESRFTSCLDGELERSPAHQQRVKLHPKRREIDFRIRANPVVFSVRAGDITIQAHRYCITNLSHTFRRAMTTTRNRSLFHENG